MDAVGSQVLTKLFNVITLQLKEQNTYTKSEVNLMLKSYCFIICLTLEFVVYTNKPLIFIFFIWTVFRPWPLINLWRLCVMMCVDQVVCSLQPEVQMYPQIVESQRVGVATGKRLFNNEWIITFLNGIVREEFLIVCMYDPRAVVYFCMIHH